MYMVNHIANIRSMYMRNIRSAQVLGQIDYITTFLSLGCMLSHQRLAWCTGTGRDISVYISMFNYLILFNLYTCILGISTGYIGGIINISICQSIRSDAHVDDKKARGLWTWMTPARRIRRIIPGLGYVVNNVSFCPLSRVPTDPLQGVTNLLLTRMILQVGCGYDPLWVQVQVRATWTIVNIWLQPGAKTWAVKKPWLFDIKGLYYRWL